MAQAKTANRGKASGSSSKKSSSRSGNSSSGSRSGAKGQAKGRSTSSGSSKGAKAKQAASKPKQAASKAKQATSNVRSDGGGILQKAKAPAIAGGVALLGIAGGIAARQSGKLGGSGGRSKVPRPNLKLPTPDLSKLPSPKELDLPKLDASALDWVEEKARGLGDAGYKVAELSSEARRMHDSITD